MTGAGAATMAFVKADGFLSIPAGPTYYRPGRNPTVEEASLSNTLERLREEDTAEAVDSLAQNLEGALSASWIVSKDVHQHVRDIVFNDGGTGFSAGRAALSRWYLGLDYLTSGGTATAERVLKGVIPLSYSLQYNQGGSIRATLTAGYADEETNTSVTPGSITGPTDGNDVPFHGATLTVDASNVGTRLNSATLSFDNISRFHRGASRTAADATLAAPSTTLTLNAIFDRTDHLELAYGSSGASSTEDTLSNVTGELSLDIAGGNVATYTLPKLKPNSYGWQDLVTADTDAAEDVEFHVNGGVSIA